MKVLASLKPYYYYLIGERIKTLEIRKSDLKNLPQNVLFYMSKDEKSFAKIPKEFQEKYRKHFGKVGIEFICDKVDEYKFHEGLIEFNSMGLPLRTYGSYLIFTDDYKSMCLSYDEVKNYGKGKTLYGWHISNLKVYDEPKELSEFYKPCKEKSCRICDCEIEYDVCRDKDVARKLDKIINCQILGLELPDDLLKWARDTIPTMKMPTPFFMDTAKWLDERFGIKFRGDDEPDLCGVCECMYYDTFGDARCKRFGDVEIKDNIRCKECVDYEREVLEERRKMRGL